MSEIISTSNGLYRCFQCRGAGIDKLIVATGKKAELLEARLREMIQVQTELKQDAAELEKIVVGNNGPCAKRLAQALKDLRVDVQAYHSCTFVGNHMHAMLKDDGPARLAAALGDNSEDRAKYEKLLTGLGRIQHYFAARFLTEDEISELERCCDQFASDLKQFLPNENITPKMHFLVAHLSRFARRHRTLGLLSEQSLESLHARINRFERQFAGIRDIERRMKMIVQHHYITSSV